MEYQFCPFCDSTEVLDKRNTTFTLKYKGVVDVIPIYVYDCYECGEEVIDKETESKLDNAFRIIKEVVDDTHRIY